MQEKSVCNIRIETESQVYNFTINLYDDENYTPETEGDTIDNLVAYFKEAFAPDTTHLKIIYTDGPVKKILLRSESKGANTLLIRTGAISAITISKQRPSEAYDPEIHG